MDQKNSDVEKSKSGNLRGKRTYSVEFRQRAVRMVNQLRSELGASRGTITRVASQLGVHPDTLGVWIRKSEIDSGTREGVSTVQSETEKKLRQELKELRRANEILRAASVFFATELDGQQNKY